VLGGAIVGDRFLVEGEAGRGGVGTVYRAVDRQGGGARVALKVLHEEGALDVDRFEREAALLADLAHPGIVRYVAHGTMGDGSQFLAMEWLDGETLEERLTASGALPPDAAVLVALRAAEALAVAHARGVVHRDVKPSNLFLVGGALDCVKVLDFGVARAPDLKPITRTGTMVGTPRYMAPEQASGLRSLDARADVFSLGCVLYECLVGEAAFPGADVMAILAKILLEDPRRPGERVRGLPPALDALVMSLLAKDADGRPRDGGAVAAALRDVQRVMSDSAPAAGGDGGGGDDSNGRSAGAGGGAAAGLAVATGRGRALPGLTITEQRVVCAVVAGGALDLPPVSASDTMPTLGPGEAGVVPRPLADALALFGARPEALADGSLVLTLGGTGPPTDQAARAARAALKLHAMLPHAPVAVATGRGVMTARAPVGEVIDRAVAALRAGAPADATVVRLDEQTAGLLDARFEVRGDAAGLYLAAERDVETARTLCGRPTTCVGRDRELATLEAQLRDCAAEQTAAAVLVTAEPGFGKSRLRYELLARLRERAERVEIVFGRGEVLGAGAPFAMLGGALRRLAGIDDGEPLEVRQRKLRARLGRHVAPADVPRVSEFLGEVAGVPFPDQDSENLRAARRDAALRGDAMRTAWEDWLEAECRAQPVLLVLEDLHWGDLPTVKLVDGALRHLREAPFMVLALARPDVHDQFPGLWAERGLQQLRLGPLPRRAAELLAREVLGEHVPPETLERLLALAAGNAFYLEELIRAVANGETAALPDTVLGMLQARLDALSPEARRALRAASVFGERLWRGGLAALLGERAAPRGEGGAGALGIDVWLADLEARELLTRQATSGLPGDVEYVFRHALVREAAYAMLTASDRALAHRLAGAWLESAAEAGLVVDAASLAHHFDYGGEPARAVRWYQSGAEQALAGNDFASVVTLADAAMRCGAAGEQRGAVRLLQAEAHAWSGDHGAALACASEAAAQLTRGAEPWFRAVGEMVDAACVQGDHGQARTWARDAAGAPAARGAEAAQLVCLCRAALRLTFAGQAHGAAELDGHIAALAGDLEGVEGAAAARVHELRALQAYFAGDAAGNLVELEGAHAAFAHAGDVRNASRTEDYLGFAYLELGDYVRAEASLRRTQAAAERLGLQSVAANALHNLGIVLARRGEDLGPARVLEQRALETFEALGEPRKEGFCRRYLAEIAYLAGDFETADAQARAAVELLAVAPPLRPGSLAMLARALLARGQTDEALAQALEAQRQLEALGAVDEGESLIRLVRAETLHATGDTAGARKAIAAACARLLERAARIADERLRRCFLESVPEHARTLALSHAWGNG
jgi:tetratricopeptide (TPR) repeat protein